MDTKFLKQLGPGFLMAAAAIGVSHLVQATRAGADYGYLMLIAIVVACVSKYPFLAVGAKFTAHTKKDLIEGYTELGKWYLTAFCVFTLGSMFIILAAVTLITAGLSEYVFGFGWSNFTWSCIILGMCFLLLQFGNFSKLDILLKIVVTLLTVSTTIAVFIAIVNYAPPILNLTPKSIWTVSGIGFLIALMGWMPIPIDASVWQSIWVKEKEKKQDIKANESLLDFNLGYFSATLLGVLFFLLGVLIMYGRGISFSNNAVDFSRQLIEMYSQTLGSWSVYFIGGIALVTMFSTTITVADAYPRVLASLQNNFLKKPSAATKKLNYSLYLIFLIGVSLALLYFLKTGFKSLVDFAAGLSFLSSPVLAWFNYKLMTTSRHKDLKPSKAHRFFMQTCLASLVIIAVAYAFMRFLI